MEEDKLVNALLSMSLKQSGIPDDGINELLNRAKENGMAVEIRRSIEKRFGIPQLPLPGESVAVTLDQPKVSALIFDRVWSFRALRDRCPPEYVVYGATDLEIWTEAVLLISDRFRQEDPTEPWEKIMHDLIDSPMGASLTNNVSPARSISEALFTQRGIHATPIYPSPEMLNREYAVGDHSTIVSTLTGIGVVDESKLTWEQVTEFRRDNAIRAKYRRFLHWLDADMAGKSVSYIRDEVALRLEDYEAALRKHGISTVLGSVETILDPKFIAASSALFAGALLGSTLPIAATATAGLFVAKAACSVARGMMNIDEAKRGQNAEVAFVHEIRKRTLDG